MKRKIFLAFLSFSLLTTASCSDDEEVGSRSDIVGVWKLKEKHVLSGKDGSILNSLNVEGCEANNIFEYTDNKKYFVTYFNEIGGECLAEQQVEGKYNYNPEYHRVTFTYPDGTSVVNNVRELEGNVMKLDFGPTDYDNDGITDTIVYVYNK